MSLITDETGKAPEPEQIDPNTVPLPLRLAAVEQALQFVMMNLKVNITENSPILGGGARQTQMTFLDWYLQQLRQAQMVVGAK